MLPPRTHSQFSTRLSSLFEQQVNGNPAISADILFYPFCVTVRTLLSMRDEPNDTPVLGSMKPLCG